MSDAKHGRRTERTVRLSEILPRPRFVACDDIVARGCSDDAGRCRAGDVFVARSTGRRDGHEEVMRAVAQGVAGVIAERIVATDGTPLCLVDDADRAHARLCHALAGDPATGLEVIAVTGTSGKTTAAWLTAAVLAEGGRQVGVLSDLGCLDADSALPERAAYGAPGVLADWLARLAAGGCTQAVVEVSHAMLARHALAGAPTGMVAVTNLGAAAVGRHGSAASERRHTARIVDTLAAGGCLVTGGVDQRLESLRRRAGRRAAGIECLTAGLDPACDVTATPVERSLHGQTFLLRAAGEMVPVAVDAPAAWFVADALVAAAIGLRHGLPLERIAHGIEAAGSVPGRMERLDRGQDVAVFLDTPSSGHGLAATLASLRRLTPGRLAVITDERWVRSIGSAVVRRRIGRWCDACLVVPPTMMADDPAATDVTAYARVDRLLGGLGRRDCLLVLGARPTGGGGGGGPDDGEHGLAAVVDGWLQLAHPPRRAGRRAA